VEVCIGLSFWTSALDGGEWPASRLCRLTPGIRRPVPIVWEAEWAPEPVSNSHSNVEKGKAVTVTGSGGPLEFQTSMIPHFINSRLTYYFEVVSLTRRPLFIPRKISGTDLTLILLHLITDYELTTQ
jgi:hypothetical protein